MVPPPVQQAQNAGTGTSLTVTLGSPTTAGNCLIVLTGTAAGTNGAVSAITLGGAAGNFGSVASQGTSGDHAIVSCWADPSCAGGQTSVLITTTGSSGTQAISAAVYEVSGMPATLAALLDKSAVFSSSGFVASWTLGPTATTTQASEIWFAIVAGNVSAVTAGTDTGPGAPWNSTALTGVNNYSGGFSFGGVTGYQVVSATGAASFNGTASPSSTFDGLVVTLKAAAGDAVLPASPLVPPGLASPAAWQHPQYRRLGRTVTIAGSGGVILPKPALSGSGLLTVTGSGGVILPKPSLAGTGAVAAPAGIARPPLMPPGLRSPAAWQFPYRRPGQVVTIAGSGGVILPKPSPSGSGAPGVLMFARAPLVPPGLASPAAWQHPQYRRLGRTVTIAGSGGVILPKPALSGSGLLTVTGSGGVILPKPSLAGTGAVAAPAGIARPPLMPPGLRSPAAWQHPRYARLPLAVTLTGITGSGGVALPKPSLAAASPPPVTASPVQGGWWQLHSIYEYARQEREFWDSQPAMACPRCGEPLRPAPPSDSGSSVESYCQFDGFRYPEDWDASTMSGM